MQHTLYRCRSSSGNDEHTGKVLFSKDKDKKTYPASMTKIMTTLIIFEKLANETLSLDDKFLVSEKAWREREGSSMFVEVDKEIRVEDLLRRNHCSVR